MSQEIIDIHWQGKDGIETLTRRQVSNGIVARLKVQGLWKELDWWSCDAQMRYIDEPWPKSWMWIAVFVVSLDEHTHHIHVDVIDRNKTQTNFYLGKTFNGIDTALCIANAITKMLPV